MQDVQPQDDFAPDVQSADKAQAASPDAKVVRKPAVAKRDDPFARPENEDDDGYDPWSDRRPAAEPLFERDPWD